MKSAGFLLLTKLIRENDTGFFAENPITEYLTEAEHEFYQYLYDHLISYGKYPAESSIVQDFDLELPDVPEPLKYYVDKFNKRKAKSILENSIAAITEQFDAPVFDIDEVLSEISSMSIRLRACQKKSNIFDFRTDNKIVFEDYDLKIKGQQSGIKLGWPTLDDMTNGVVGGDVISFIGRPQMGKTYKMLYSANYTWSKQGKRALFVSMEMNPLLIFQRLTAIYTSKTISKLRSASFPSSALEEIKEKLAALESYDFPFWLVYGDSRTTVNDLFLIVSELKPEVVFIDGAYMLAHENKRLNKFDRVSENCDLIKFKLAAEFDIPVILSYQFNRAMTGKTKRGQKPGLEDIAYSDSIGQYSSVVLGLFEDDDSSTQDRRRIDVLKGRSGETGEFHINWDFLKMDFTECKAQKGDVLDFTE